MAIKSTSIKPNSIKIYMYEIKSSFSEIKKKKQKNKQTKSPERIKIQRRQMAAPSTQCAPPPLDGAHKNP